jgi:hypothetical protein
MAAACYLEIVRGGWDDYKTASTKKRVFLIDAVDIE